MVYFTSLISATFFDTVYSSYLHVEVLYT